MSEAILEAGSGSILAGQLLAARPDVRAVAPLSHLAADAAISEARRHRSVIVPRAAVDPAESGPGGARGAIMGRVLR